MTHFMKQSAASQLNSNLPWLADFTSQAKVVCEGLSLPGRKTENWKYTSLKHIETSGFYQHSDAVSQEQDIKGLSLSELAINGISGPVLVFVDGVFSSELSALPEQQADAGYSVVPFSQANSSQQAMINEHLGSVVALSRNTDHPFASLNGSNVDEGVFIHVQKNKALSEPVQIVSISMPNTQPVTINQRVLVVLDECSEATVIERFIGDGEQKPLTNGITELCLNDSARLTHYRLHQEGEQSSHIGGVHCRLERAANLNSFQLAMGSKLTRVDVVVHHRGEGAHCDLNGVYLPQHQQHVDFHTTIEHAVPHCTTSEIFRGIVGDSAKAVFNGRIHIHPDAQKTLAQLSNKNLLTSDKAEVNTKPELEIYADDVQCAHGATVAQLDKESVHYLKTRGVSEDDAMVMLSFGFINELINQITDQAVADFIRPELNRLFARHSNLQE